MIKKQKIINDPVYGFINIPGGLIFKLIEHPYFQRLRRIKQLGLTYLVYPGAAHTRFQHSIGSMHLVNLAIDVIRSKGHKITEDEAEATRIAILLHDIGHGPFSHALENCIIPDLHHEKLSLWFMDELNKEFNSELSLAISIFKNQYHKKFLHQLVAGQLDMDRLDYLRRDSFFTGVTEGVVGSQRIIKMLQVVDDNLVVEAKGIYSIEKFLIARRLMYWQVYLHKTVLVGELLLSHFLKRLKYLYKEKGIKTGNVYLDFLFEDNNMSDKELIIKNFSMLDDYDIMSLIKQNINSQDRVIAGLASSLINRKLPRIRLSKEEIDYDFLNKIKQQFMKKYNFSAEETDYFVYSGEISNNAYDREDERINILFGEKLVDITEASDILNISVLGKIVKKNYICAPKYIMNKIS
ncbi:MAG: HD domain-containing protein [Bacteroidales bacterium]|nr:HD domain-containing protein [Bacteroidales bacterium]OQC45790.1 MAG: HD domain protein [Bacteroidetes bacterium ADurb.Bin028]HNY44976.1 HD domain-containing protein [Bacteroidales bacterium]HOD89330.1 HD domain-containing protein [Bacteroidales bacterium]